MIALIDDGIAVTSRSSEDCMTFGIRLQEALNEFTSAFLPHMKQEEEVFQVTSINIVVLLWFLYYKKSLSQIHSY